jgi:hypothetical protein
MLKIYNSKRKYIDFFSNIKKKIAFCLIFTLFFDILGWSVTRDQVYRYIELYKNDALIEQRDNGVPASITLAQGLLESAAGTSKLAREGNNHFGVKCHRHRGDSIFLGKTCYRKYRTAHDSYLDHSRFLRENKRYQSLFLLDISDYRGWAHGLKRCGYATDPLYAQKLIAMIETYGLNQFARESPVENVKPEEGPQLRKKRDHPIFRHPIKRRHGLNYVVAVMGDTYQDIADEFNVKKEKLLEYNDLNESAGDEPEPGDIVYVNKKHGESQGVHELYRVRDDNETLWLVSQMFGIKLHELARMNNLDPAAPLHKGQPIKLKKNIDIENAVENNDDELLQD